MTPNERDAGDADQPPRARKGRARKLRDLRPDGVAGVECELGGGLYDVRLDSESQA